MVCFGPKLALDILRRTDTHQSGLGHLHNIFSVHLDIVRYYIEVVRSLAHARAVLLMNNGEVCFQELETVDLAFGMGKLSEIIGGLVYVGPPPLM